MNRPQLKHEGTESTYLSHRVRPSQESEGCLRNAIAGKGPQDGLYWGHPRPAARKRTSSWQSSTKQWAKRCSRQSKLGAIAFSCIQLKPWEARSKYCPCFWVDPSAGQTGETKSYQMEASWSPEESLGLDIVTIIFHGIMHREQVCESSEARERTC